MQSDLKLLFSQGLESLNLVLDTQNQQKLLNFLVFLQKWNCHYNLTAISDLEKMIPYHLLDSLSVVPYIFGESILDVGTGAGFPGIPLAVYFSDKKFVLMDSNGKKTRFLIQAKSEFGLKNIEIIQERAEQWHSPLLFNQIITRAVGSIEDIISQTRHLLKSDGEWLFMKGDLPQEKLDNLNTNHLIHKLNVPNIDLPRSLIIIPKDPPK